AMWYPTLGLFDRNNIDTSGEEHRLLQPETIRRMTAYGEVYRMAPPVEFTATPGYWDDPILTVRGSSKPEWEERAKPKKSAGANPQALASRLSRRRSRSKTA